MTKVKDRFSITDPRNQSYSDITNDLTPHPVVKDVLRYVNENAINKSIRNLILTNKGERLFQPEIGCDVNKLLFEPMGEGVGEIMSKTIESTITEYEPRAKIINVAAIPDYDNNAYQVIIQYMIINRQNPVTLNITLTRVR